MTELQSAPWVESARPRRSALQPIVPWDRPTQRFDELEPAPTPSLVAVPDTGSCLLYSVIVTDPVTVRDRLAAAGLDSDVRLIQWLAQPHTVRAGVARLTG